MAVLPAAHPGVGRLTAIDAVDAAPGDILRDSGPISDVDVAHVHLGHDFPSVGVVERAMASLASSGVPVLLTVHDIDHPSDLEDPQLFEHVGALVTTAARVVTLTEEGALRLLERWDVAAAVVPHPRLLDESEISTAVRAANHLRGGGQRGDGQPGSGQGPVVGVLLERMGENIEGPKLLDKLAPVPTGRQDAELRILVESRSWQEAVGEEPGTHGDPLVSELAGEGDWRSVRLVTYEALDLGPLLPELAALDVCVLPYRFASHSTWLELCRDLGVAAVFPDLGFLAGQWFSGHDPAQFGGQAYSPVDPVAVARGVSAVLDQPKPVPPRIEASAAQSVMEAYAKLYREVAAAGAAG